MHTFLHFQVTLFSIAFTALCRPLCLLLGIKEDIPSYARPIKCDISETITFPFPCLVCEKLDNIKDISFMKVLCAVKLLEKNAQMVLFSYSKV